MKNEGLKKAAAVISAAALCFGVMLGAAYGMTYLPREYTVSPVSEGAPVTASRADAAYGLDDRAPACGGAEQSEEASDTPVKAVNLCGYGADDPQLLISDYSGLTYDLSALLAETLPTLACDGTPEVLIYHTHASEAYAPGDTYEDGYLFVSDDDAESVIAVGEAFAEALRAHGVGVIHDTFRNDAAGYNLAYTSSRAKVISSLSSHSTLKYIIDLHRDSVSADGAERKVTAEISGEATAQVMCVVGSAHRGYETNLAVSAQLQRALNLMYPTLARPIYLSKGEYNQSLLPTSMLLEIGAAGNTLEEAKRAAVLTAEAFFACFGKTA